MKSRANDNARSADFRVKFGLVLLGLLAASFGGGLLGFGAGDPSLAVALLAIGATTVLAMCVTWRAS